MRVGLGAVGVLALLALPSLLHERVHGGGVWEEADASVRLGVAVVALVGLATRRPAVHRIHTRTVGGASAFVVYVVLLFGRLP